MRIGFVGLGNLGLPVALAMAGHVGEVVGTDAFPEVEGQIARRELRHPEAGIDPAWWKRLAWAPSVRAVCARADVIFIAVQTPHGPEHEGITRLPRGLADFDYRFLTAALAQVAEGLEQEDRQATVAVISTVLPGTFARLLLPRRTPRMRGLLYTPAFIAMGTTVPDLLQPEFSVVGGSGLVQTLGRYDDAMPVVGIYRRLHAAPILVTDHLHAELVKMLYNTFIGLKIAFGNTVGDLCEALGGDADVVVSALSHATDRLISARYLRPGMGDAGACHPRDAIAMAWLSDKLLGPRYNLFQTIMEVREAQTDLLATQVELALFAHGLEPPVILLGAAYKPDTDITTGSCTFLLASLLAERNVSRETFDPVAWPNQHGGIPNRPVLAVHCTAHAAFRELKLPEGSVVLDPWGTFLERPGVTVVRLGRRAAPATWC